MYQGNGRVLHVSKFICVTEAALLLNADVSHDSDIFKLFWGGWELQ